MRSVTILFSLSLGIWSLARAGAAEVPARHLTAMLETPYSTTVYTVFEKGGKTFCQTRGNGSVEMRENPLVGLDLKKLGSRKPDPACRDRVHIRDARAAVTTRFEGCYSDPFFRNLLLGLDRSCQP